MLPVISGAAAQEPEGPLFLIGRKKKVFLFVVRIKKLTNKKKEGGI